MQNKKKSYSDAVAGARKRLAFALNRAQYAVCCDDEANHHYGIKASRLWQAKCFFAGWLEGLTAAKVPDGFMDTAEELCTNKTTTPFSAHPTSEQIASACLSFRHDYGLMDDAERKQLESTCALWWEAIAKAVKIR